MVTKIRSNSSIEVKKRIIDRYILVAKGKQYTMTENIAKLQYRNKYWNSIDVHITIDEDSFLLNAKSAGSGSFGFVDFGISRRGEKNRTLFTKAIYNNIDEVG